CRRLPSRSPCAPTTTCSVSLPDALPISGIRATSSRASVLLPDPAYPEMPTTIGWSASPMHCETAAVTPSRSIAPRYRATLFRPPSPVEAGRGAESRRLGCPRTSRRGRERSVIERLGLPFSARAQGMTLAIRRATRDDLDSIIRLLSDDPISAGRGDVASAEDAEAYACALDRIIDDPSNEIVVAVDQD